MQIALLISDFKEDKAWFISKDEDYALSVKAVRDSLSKTAAEE